MSTRRRASEMCTHTWRRLSRSVSKGMPYVLNHASKASVPRTLSILSNWSSLSTPRKKCSFRKICDENEMEEHNRSCTCHGREHAPYAPYIETVVVQLVPDEQLRRLVITRPNTDVIHRARMIKLGQPPIDQPQLDQDSTFTRKECTKTPPCGVDDRS